MRRVPTFFAWFFVTLDRDIRMIYLNCSQVAVKLLFYMYFIRISIFILTYIKKIPIKCRISDFQSIFILGKIKLKQEWIPVWYISAVAVAILLRSVWLDITVGRHSPSGQTVPGQTPPWQTPAWACTPSMSLYHFYLPHIPLYHTPSIPHPSFFYKPPPPSIPHPSPCGQTNTCENITFPPCFVCGR